MKVKFRRSGGFMGLLPFGCYLDTDKMDPEVAKGIVNLFESSGISKSGEFVSPGSRDFYVYEIKIEKNNGETISVVYDDGTLPIEAQYFVHYLFGCSSQKGDNNE